MEHVDGPGLADKREFHFWSMWDDDDANRVTNKQRSHVCLSGIAGFPVYSGKVFVEPFPDCRAVGSNTMETPKEQTVCTNEVGEENARAQLHGLNPLPPQTASSCGLLPVSKTKSSWTVSSPMSPNRLLWEMAQPGSKRVLPKWVK